jgi:hypothetical protein
MALEVADRERLRRRDAAAFGPIALQAQCRSRR